MERYLTWQIPSRPLSEPQDCPCPSLLWEWAMQISLPWTSWIVTKACKLLDSGRRTPWCPCSYLWKYGLRLSPAWPLIIVAESAGSVSHFKEANSRLTLCDVSSQVSSVSTVSSFHCTHFSCAVEGNIYLTGSCTIVKECCVAFCADCGLVQRLQRETLFSLYLSGTSSRYIKWLHDT